MKMVGLLLIAVWFLLPGVQAQGNKGRVTMPGAHVEKLAGDFLFTEGPACDLHGNVFFTDQPNDRIMMWSVDGRLSTFMQPSGRSNGLCFDKKGRLWACADEKNEIWIISPQKKVTIAVQGFQGKLLNGPNDLWIRPDGGIYFSDPMYRRNYWTRDPKSQMEGQYVFFLTPDHKTLKAVLTDLRQPNGLIGSPDGKILYVADIADRKTYRYEVQKDGSLLHRQLFCRMGSDGMTIDQRGNVYLTGKGVTVFNKQGIQIEQIDVPEKWTANVCFGGRDRKLLFITASTGIYGIRMAVRGAGSQ